jgi:O-antigen/teichoic acid export membrane protein
MRGNTLAQLIPIAIAPIIARLYTPEDFGVFALFVAIVTILSSVNTGRYELAIILGKKDEEAINLGALSFFVATLFSTLLLIFILFFNKQLLDLLNNQDIGFWLYFVPFVLLIIGFFKICNNLCLRKKLFADIAKATVYKTTSMSAVQLGFIFIKSGSTGLILGKIVSHVFANYQLAKKIKQNYDLKKIRAIKMKRLAKRFINFLKYSWPASLTNNITLSLISIFSSIFFNSTILGFYYLAHSLLSIPSVLIGSAISNVFFKEAFDEKQRKGNVIVTFDKVFLKLALISLVIFSPLIFIAEDLFVIFFGEDWRIAGVYSKYLIPMFAVRFIVSSLLNVDTIMEKQNLNLYFNIVLLFTTLSVIFFSRFLEFDNFLIFFSISTSLVHLAYFYLLRKIAKNEL